MLVVNNLQNVPIIIINYIYIYLIKMAELPFSVQFYIVFEICIYYAAEAKKQKQIITGKLNET